MTFLEATFLQLHVSQSQIYSSYMKSMLSKTFSALKIITMAEIEKKTPSIQRELLQTQAPEASQNAGAQSLLDCDENFNLQAFCLLQCILHSGFTVYMYIYTTCFSLTDYMHFEAEDKRMSFSLSIQLSIVLPLPPTGTLQSPVSLLDVDVSSTIRCLDEVCCILYLYLNQTYLKYIKQ